MQGTSIQPGEHVVMFYDSEAELVTLMCRYLADAARYDEPAIVISTEAHYKALKAPLAAIGIGMPDASRHCNWVWLDASIMLAKLCPCGRVDGDAFEFYVGRVIREAAAGGRRVWAYGEMVALLWAIGDVLGVIELESAWGNLGREVTFSLVCSYPAEFVADPQLALALQQACDLHSSVLGRRPVEDGRPSCLQAVAGITEEFVPTLDAPRAARCFVLRELEARGYAAKLVDDVALVTSELAANAVVHAGTHFSVNLRTDERAVVRVSVRDGSCDAPEARFCGQTEQSGRGLHVVAALATRWGIEQLGQGKRVWAEFREPS